MPRLDCHMSVRIIVILAVAIAVAPLVLHGQTTVVPLDPVPNAIKQGRLERTGPDVLLHLSGSPKQIGQQHGALLKKTIRTLLADYIRPNLEGEHGQRLLSAAKVLHKNLPKDYREELDACAEAAGVDVHELLLAQCLGDMESAIIGVTFSESHACSSYVAFGPATADGSLQCGRNFDYFFSNKLTRCATLVTYYTPEQGQGYRFAAVGLAGVLGGWTLINERGLIVANHLGGGIKTRLDGIPTLILTREIAQHAATVDEAIKLLENTPRMRGQIIWIAQDADKAAGRPARAVAVEYDAARMVVRESEGGVLIVTNENRAFNGPPAAYEVTTRYSRIQELIQEKYGRLAPQDALMLSTGVANSITLHSAQIHPAQGTFQLWIRPEAGQQDGAVEFRMP